MNVSQRPSKPLLSTNTILLMICSLILVGCAGETSRKEASDHGTPKANVAVASDSISGDLVVVTAERIVADGCRSGKTSTITREELLNSTTNSVSAEAARSSRVGSNGRVNGSRRSEAATLRAGVDVIDPISGGGLASLPPVDLSSSVAITVESESSLLGGRKQDDQSIGATVDVTSDNPFRSTTHTPLSTFSIDVDAASYTNVRGYIERGSAPPAESVRIEELVNYFNYHYPDPTDHHPFAFATQVAPAPWDTTHRLVRVALQGKRVNHQELPPANLVFLVDVSGSMSDDITLIKQAFSKLIDQLRPEDRVAIVVYAGAAGTVLNSTGGVEKKVIASALNNLQAGGSTAGGAGINLAYKIAADNFIEGGNNRIILATDGDFNVGVSSQTGLVSLIEEKREAGIYLSVLGFGRGNYQDAKMEQLADNGNGVYYYIDKLQEAERVFGSGLAGTLLTIAKDVKLQIRFNAEHVAAYRLIGYENRLLTAQEFSDDKKDAGELGAGHAVTAFYEVIPHGTPSSVSIDSSNAEEHNLEDEAPVFLTRHDILLARLRYKRPTDTTSILLEHLVRDEPLALDATDDDFRFAAAVAGWGMVLRGSQYAGTMSGADVVMLATSGLGRDADSERAGFVELVASWIRNDAMTVTSP